ncbi:hypothetical protein M3Y99_00933200 [Aphelenchoides fujianensis]|nr:hypothetical protein M3Y99_00933200 [Aphelenchoides fujianensis]
MDDVAAFLDELSFSFGAPAAERADGGDVLIKAGDVLFHADREQLAAHSPVFARALRRSTRLEVGGFAATAVGEALRFVHAAVFFAADERALTDVHEVAVHFELRELEAVCSRVLAADLSAANVLRRLRWADRSGARECRRLFRQFALDHWELLLDRLDLDEFFHSDLSVLEDFFSEVSSSR